MADGVRKDEEFSGTREVEERHRVNEANLAKWMSENVEGFAGPLTVLQFKGGQSNPTYKIETAARSYVMRRKPFGKLLPSAHAVDREFRVIAALGKQGFPVAKAYALCNDDAVIGAAFYIMSMEEGRVFWDPSLPSQTPDARRKIFTSKIETRSCGGTVFGSHSASFSNSGMCWVSDARYCLVQRSTWRAK